MLFSTSGGSGNVTLDNCLLFRQPYKKAHLHKNECKALVYFIEPFQTHLVKEHLRVSPRSLAPSRVQR